MIEQQAEFIISTHEQTIIIIAAAILFCFVCYRRRDLLKWLPIYLLLVVGSIISSFKEIFADATLFSNLINAGAVIFLLIATTIEYRETFKSSKSSEKLKHLKAVVAVSPIVLGLQIFIMITCLISIFMLLKIYNKKKDPTHAFFCISVICAIITLILGIFTDLGFLDSTEYGLGVIFFFYTILLVNGIYFDEYIHRHPQLLYFLLISLFLLLAFYYTTSTQYC